MLHFKHLEYSRSTGSLFCLVCLTLPSTKDHMTKDSLVISDKTRHDYVPVTVVVVGMFNSSQRQHIRKQEEHLGQAKRHYVLFVRIRVSWEPRNDKVRSDSVYSSVQDGRCLNSSTLPHHLLLLLSSSLFCLFRDSVAIMSDKSSWKS